VDEELREKIVSAFERAIQVAGAKGYEDGIKQALRLIDFAYSGVRSMQTTDELRNVLDALPPLSEREQQILLYLVSQLPQLLRTGLKLASHKAASTLPAAGNGRPPAASAEEAQEILNYISELHRKNCTLRVAKERAAKKYRKSKRTIDRIWTNRASIPTVTLTVPDLLAMFLTVQGSEPGEN